MRMTKSEGLGQQWNIIRSLTLGSLYNTTFKGKKVGNEFLSIYPPNNKHTSPIGQLSFKKEPAGKVRIFAMVDIWTQSLLKPLHATLFRILKHIPNDGTFDQSAAFKRAVDKSLVANKSFCYDLTAATDRLPVSSQVSILNSIFQNNIGTLWSEIIINRDYVIPSGKYYGITEEKVRYAVGQPMGALSSWAMLALTHHLMLQYCAFITGRVRYPDWFEGYEILGDDLVIFDDIVAKEYLKLCQGIGVSINLAKSVVATKPSLEFAKRSSLGKYDVSPLSFKEMLMSNNFFGRLQQTVRLMQNGWGKSNQVLWRLGNLQSRYFIKETQLPYIALMMRLVQQGRLSFETATNVLVDPKKPLSFFGRKFVQLQKGVSEDILKGFLDPTFDFTNLIPSREAIMFNINRMYSYKASIRLKLNKLLDR